MIPNKFSSIALIQAGNLRITPEQNSGFHIPDEGFPSSKRMTSSCPFNPFSSFTSPHSSRTSSRTPSLPPLYFGFPLVPLLYGERLTVVAAPFHEQINQEGQGLAAAEPERRIPVAHLGMAEQLEVEGAHAVWLRQGMGWLHPGCRGFVCSGQLQNIIQEQNRDDTQKALSRRASPVSSAAVPDRTTLMMFALFVIVSGAARPASSWVRSPS
jgi:hypothetical protein